MGTCVGTDTSAQDCDDKNDCTTDTCDSASTGDTGCVNTFDTTRHCSDDDVCTENERCESGGCVTDVVSCDDGNLCTTDYCMSDEPYSGCMHSYNSLVCNDDNSCTTGETCYEGDCHPASYVDDCCGNGEREPEGHLGEECDDGNQVNGDFCSYPTCSLPCGDSDGSGSVGIADAPIILAYAVGRSDECPLHLCDINGNGGVTALDALMVMQLVVNQQVILDCPSRIVGAAAEQAAPGSTTSTTSTTMP